MTTLLIISLLIYLGSGVLSLLCKRGSTLCGVIGSAGSIVAAATGIIPVLKVLTGGKALDLQLPWNLPLGSLHLHLDVLSAWFALPVLLISALAAIYGSGYLRRQERTFNTNMNWLFLQLLSGGMLLVLVAWDGVLFLLAWEIMSFAAWFLVMFEHNQNSVQRAGWIYLAATHLGTAFLFVMFILLQNSSGSFDFSSLTGLTKSASIIFILAVIGFGTKAGFFSMHVWLPEAHPAAPSHVSGLMSGVMIKIGIYGLIRTMTMLTPWPDWWGWLLIGIGVVSGLGGVLFALVQHDIKRLLAYHSVENIGIICLGLGVGVIGINRAYPVALLGIAGALLHVINHSVFKTALFMSAGSVVHATGTRDIDVLGGLQKKMPATALAFLISAAAICGLPPLNGFVSELLIYLASYKSVMLNNTSAVNCALSGFVIIASLALIGGLAVLCFTKVFGVVFLGEARTTRYANVHESCCSMRLPMLALACACVVLGLGGFFMVKLVTPVAAIVLPFGMSVQSLVPLLNASQTFIYVSAIAAGLLLLVAILWLLRSKLLKNRSVVRTGTWGCGYTAPTARMQYTGSSFVQPLTHAFKSLFRTEQHSELPSGKLPRASHFATHTPDLFMRFVYEPVFKAFAAMFAWLRVIQHGRLHLYIFYIILTLVIILVWSFL